MVCVGFQRRVFDFVPAKSQFNMYNFKVLNLNYPNWICPGICRHASDVTRQSVARTPAFVALVSVFLVPLPASHGDSNNMAHCSSSIHTRYSSRTDTVTHWFPFQSVMSTNSRNSYHSTLFSSCALGVGHSDPTPDARTFLALAAVIFSVFICSRGFSSKLRHAVKSLF